MTTFVVLLKKTTGLVLSIAKKSLAEQYFCLSNEQQQLWLKSHHDEALLDRSKPKRRYREIQILNDTERKRYLDAVNALKKDEVIIIKEVFLETN